LHLSLPIDVLNPLLSAVPSVPGNMDDQPEIPESDSSSKSYVSSAEKDAPLTVQGKNNILDSLDKDCNQREGKKPARWCLSVYRKVLLQYFNKYHALPSSEQSDFIYKVYKKLCKIAKREDTAISKDLLKVHLLYLLFCRNDTNHFTESVKLVPQQERGPLLEGCSLPAGPLQEEKTRRRQQVNNLLHRGLLAIPRRINTVL
jgi:hypothetical protein